MQLWKRKLLSYLTGIVEYRWYALGVAWLVCLVGWGVVAAMPDKYTAEAKVYIDTENLMDPLLKGLTVSIDPAQEIAVMLKTLITRPTLEQVIHLNDAKANSLGPAQMEQKVTALQNAISIRQLETKNYFAIGYSDNNSDYATSVTQTLLSILQDSRIGGTRLDMDAARSFIGKKIAEYEDRLRDADKRRADFRTANVEILSKGTAASRIDTADAELEKAKKDLAAAAARRDSMAQQLAGTPKTVPVDQRMFGGGVGVANANNANMDMPAMAGRGSPPPPLTNPVQRMQQAETTLSELRTRYTEEHPDVVAQKKLIAQIQAQLSALPGEAPPDTTPVIIPNQVYASLQAKLFDEETNVAAQRQRVETATNELARAKNDASRAIDTLAKFTDLDRDYGNIEITYKELLQSREAASLSQARDDQNQGVSFRILDPPKKPQFPAGPYRFLLNSLVLLGGIGAGVAATILLTLNAGRFITSDDVATHFGVPLIGVITALPRATGLRRNSFSTWALSGSAALLLLSYISVIAIMRTSIYSVFGI